MVKTKPRLRQAIYILPDGQNSVRSIDENGRVISSQTFTNEEQKIKIRASMIQAATAPAQIESAPVDTTTALIQSTTDSVISEDNNSEITDFSVFYDTSNDFFNFETDLELSFF